MENDPIRALVIRRMHELGVSELALSQSIGKNNAYINQYLYRGIPERLHEGTRHDIAVALSLNEKDLITPQKENERNKKSPLKSSTGGSKEDTQFGPDMVPVLGVANGSSEALVLNFDEPIGEVPRHPNQAGMMGSYAFEARGESMAPRYFPGDTVYAIKNKQPKKSQDCHVVLTNNESFLKTFSKQTAKEIICTQYNPVREVRWSLSEIKSINAVVGRG